MSWQLGAFIIFQQIFQNHCNIPADNVIKGPFYKTFFFGGIHRKANNNTVESHVLA